MATDHRDSRFLVTKHRMGGSSVPAWQRAIIVMSGTLVGFILVVSLQWSRPVLIPLALAVIFTLLLNPVVKFLHRCGLGQILSALITVSVAASVLLFFGYLIGKQVTALMAELPQNTEKIKAKVKALKQLGSGPMQEQLGHMIEEISNELYAPLPQKSDSLIPKEDVEVDPKSGTVIVKSSEPSGWLNISGYVGSAFESMAMLAFASVMLVFFLIERADLRDRIVIMAGRARLPLTSKAIEDITDRVSRYIGVVALINGGFGLVLTLGLLVIGVPYALLWGVVAAALRFLPYIGPWVGAIFPITISLATADGWGEPLAVLAFVAVIELVTNNVIEPLLFGHMTGVAPFALLVSAAFWLYLWGPVGLLLSAPFAVCLVVIGKNIPQLNFLYVLLGDKPALAADYSYYQRLMLGDYQEAASMALKRFMQPNPHKMYDELIIPALNYTKRDFERDYLTEEERDAIASGARESLKVVQKSLESTADRIVDSAQKTQPIAGKGDSDDESRIDVLCCPASDDIDHLTLEMLQQLMGSPRWRFEIASTDTLSSELIERVRQLQPAIVVIGATPPGGLAQAKYLCKRLRKEFSELRIVVVRCGQRRTRRVQEILQRYGASSITTSLLDTQRFLNSRLPVLEFQHHASEHFEQSDAEFAHS